MGLDIYLQKRIENIKDEDETIEIPSQKYPDHLFKVGYFRSSYNKGGINGVLGNLGLLDLYGIFEPGNEYEFTPDWVSAFGKTKEVVEKLKGIQEKGDNYGVATEYFKKIGDIDLPTNKAEAMAKFMERKNNKGSMEAFSNREGTFYLSEPLAVHGMIKGKDDIFGDVIYIIYKKDLSSYIQSLEIVLETIEYVLAQPDKEKYYLTWSA